MKDWLSSKEAFTNEYDYRGAHKKGDFCSYGISPLDEALSCIMKNELVVIGADAGYGKTEVALKIASHNASQGKRVALYHLEGGVNEAIARIKWQMITAQYFINFKDACVNLDYKRWLMNDCDPLLKTIEQEIYPDFITHYGENLFFYNAKAGLTLDEFIFSILHFNDSKSNLYSIIEQHKFNLDLIVIDHLQYFSLDKPESEISEITNILRTVKGITDSYKIPVVLVSHLRKRYKDRGLPDQEDFYGSSNIPKIASTAITIAPYSEKSNVAEHTYPTFFRVVKSRVGARPNYAYLTDFCGRKKEYSKNYRIYKLDSFNKVDEEKILKFPNIPDWAESAIRE